MKKTFGIGGVCLLAALSFFYYGCSSSGDGGDSIARTETITYSGPGSFMKATLNADGTGSIEIREMHTDVDPLMTVAVDFEEVDDTGVLEFTVTGVDPEDIDDGPTIGAKAHAIEILGFGLFMLPLGGDEILPMLTAGDCATEDFTANWIQAQGGGDSDASSEDRDFFGTFSYDISENTGEVTSKNALTDGFPDIAVEGQESITGSCENGLMSLEEDGDPVALMFLTDNGGAIVQTFELNEETEEFETGSAIVAFPKQVNSIEGLEGTFRGILFQGGENNNSEDANNFFVEMTFDDAGQGTGRQVTQVNPWETGDDAATISLAASDIGDGWYTGTLDVPDEASANIACSFIENIEDSTTDALLCVGQSPGDLAEASDQVGAINFLMVKQD
ncbi:MAG: hypothetical protein KDK51_05840 [Deltaproteobacteria bacterium]|nr:hypothetical protein [Deltaproteobacteria bacterium]